MTITKPHHCQEGDLFYSCNYYHCHVDIFVDIFLYFSIEHLKLYLNLIRVWYFYLLLPYERKKERDVCLHSTVLKYFQQKRNFISVLENIPHH